MTRMGRPELPKEIVRGKKVSFRLTATMRDSLDKAAKHKGMTLSKYIEDVLNNHIESKKG
jgi:predicted DNA-binding protein